MRCLARTSLGMLGLTLIAPWGVGAQEVYTSAPAGYGAAAPSAGAVPLGLDGKPFQPVSEPAPIATPAPAPVAAQPAPHRHLGKTLASCAAKLKAQAAAMPPGKIVGCAHSRNGVCTACQAAWDGPGQVVMMGSPAPAGEAPGRAVASKGMAPSGEQMAARSGLGVSSAPYDGASGDPTPVGVVQANYAPAAPPGMPSSSYASVASQPGHAVAEAGAGNEPYQKKGSSFPHPHIIGHLLGWSGLGNDRADEKARKKAEAHAMISYDSNGASSTSVEELPASAVYSKKNR